MICPHCQKPYFFLDRPQRESRGHCERCHFRGAVQWPSYDSYHEDLYLSKSYRRTCQTDPQMNWILKTLRIQPSDVAVDLGCGVGDYTQAIGNLTKQVKGFDLNVEAARRKYPGLLFLELDFTKEIPLPASSVDKIISINTIEHLLDYEFFLKECRRILKPGGLIALSTANKSFILHDLHYDATHLHEWTLAGFTQLAGEYFKKLAAKKDCAMFYYFPLNRVAGIFLKPDITFIGERSDC